MALDRAERQVEPVRDLVVREVVVEREPQDGALRVAQPVQLVGDDDAVDDPVVDGRTGTSAAPADRLVPEPAVAGAALVGVRDDVPRDAEQPGGQP